MEDLLRKHDVFYMTERNHFTRKEAEAAAEYFYAVINVYWDESLSEKLADLEAIPGRKPFYKCTEGYAYRWWMKTLIESASPDLAGFTLPR